MYLTAAELAQLTGYQPNQFARMRRWLKDHGWPYEDPGAGGCPRVWREYHDQRMSGTAPARATVAANDASTTPNRARLQALQNGRKKKIG
ncbi:MAG TPA: DUF4224 domain-containing protein [Ramlibacter sp.]|nr:DUF4224 domain-containing protein [Ramlibacter sp.]